MLCLPYAGFSIVNPSASLIVRPKATALSCPTPQTPSSLALEPRAQAGLRPSRQSRLPSGLRPFRYHNPTVCELPCLPLAGPKATAPSCPTATLCDPPPLSEIDSGLSNIKNLLFLVKFFLSKFTFFCGKITFSCTFFFNLLF